MPPRTPSRPDRRLGRILAGLTALATLVALVVAVPAVLAAAWRYLGAPVPSIHDLTGPDDGTVMVRVLCLVGWLGWGTFTWSLLAELLAQWRGWRLPALGWQRRVAASLVASITMMLNAPAIASGAAAVAVIAAPAPAVAAPLVPTAHTVPDAGSRQPAYLTHQVKRGEQLPDLAQRHLGDRYQWQQIAAANYGTVQPDGRSLQPGDSRIYPGWTLRIPAPTVLVADTTSALPATPTTSATATGALVYQVHHGDWLWYIAARFLGDPNRYPEIAALNPHLISARTGTHGPDHIEAGWHLVLPADAHDSGSRTHAAGTIDAAPTAPTPGPAAGSGVQSPAPPASLPPAPAPAPSSVAPKPSAPTTAPPAASPSATQDATASPRAAASSHTPSPTASTPAPAAPVGSARPSPAPTSYTDHAPGTHDSASDGDRVPVYLGLGGAGLLAALLLTTVLRRRRRQQQHRRPQRRLPHPRDGATETTLRVIEQPVDVDRLDHALRALAAALADYDQNDLPDILAAWIVGGTVHLVLGRSCPHVPAGWIDDGHQWTLPATAELPDTDGTIAPLPTLVAVGSQPGRHLLVDLERIGHLHISGDPDRSGNLLRYIASELSCNSWSDDVEILLAGFGQEESELLVALNPDRIRAAASVAAAVARMRRRVATSSATLRHVKANDALAGRVGDLAGDAWMPQILLVADPTGTDLETLAPLVDELRTTGRCAVAVATAGTTTPLVNGARLTVRADGSMHVAYATLDATTSAAGLPADQLEPLAEIMRQARAATDEPVPAAREREPWAAGTDAAGGLLDLFGREPGIPEPAPDEPGIVIPIQSARVEDPPAPEHAAGEQPERLAAASGGSTAAIAAIALTGPRKTVTAAVRQRRRQADPHLDEDLAAWREQDPMLVRVAVLGPVEVAAPGEEPTERRRFLAEIIVYLAQRGARGATADKLTDALWPDGNVKDASRRVAITRARRWLGTNEAGQPWLPDMTGDRTYRLTPGVLLDWHLFRRLRARGEAHGPAGAKDLRAALELIRGVPLDGADRAYAAGARNPYPWLAESEIYPGHIVSAIADTAHQLAELYLEAGDTTNARWAVHQAWLADPYRGDDELWRDLMRAEHLDGHTAELRQLLGELIQARDAEVPEDLNKETYAWLCATLPEILGVPSAR